MEDAEIVEKYLKRDESALNDTAKKYGTALRAIANRILSDPQTAEECENDTYLEAWNRIPPNEPKTYFFAFLGCIIRHRAIDRCRQDRSALFCELTEEMDACIPENAESTAMGRDLKKAINAFLATCSREQRMIFVRRYWFFDSIPEICKRYGFSQSKVKTTLFRMRSQLRRFLENGGYIV